MEDAAAPPSLSSSRRLAGVFWALLLLSAAVQLMPGAGSPITAFQAAWLALAATAAGVLALRRTAGAPVARHRAFLPRARRHATLVVSLAAAGYFLYAARTRHRYLLPFWNDEHSYLIQTRMLARGWLWAAPHPLADAFETFHMLARPVYGSTYFPGTALLYVPAVWLNLPVWAGPVVAAGVVVGLTYRVVAELVDDLGGLLAALLVVANPMLQDFATRFMAQTPAALMGLLLAWAWLRWRAVAGATPDDPPRVRSKARPVAWAAAMGAFAAWGAIVRPFDGLAFAAPVACAVAWDLRRVSWPARLKTTAAACAGAAPFLALQLVLNVGATGRPWTTPYAVGQAAELPGMFPGFRPFDPDARPASDLPQKHLAYQGFVKEMREHRLENVPAQLWDLARLAAKHTIACPLLVLLAPLAFRRAGRGRRWALAAALPLFVALYALYPIFLLHYLVPMAPVSAFLVVIGADAVIHLSDRPAYRRFAQVFLPLAVFGLTLGALPELDRTSAQRPSDGAGAKQLNERLAAEVARPAIVLFRYDAAAYGRGEMEEPVYNSDVAWPDDAPVIRAHDLGPARNRALFAYYAARAPGRHVYRYDWADDSIRPLGTVAELAAE